MRALLSLLLTAAFAAGAPKAVPAPIAPNIEKVVRAYVSDQQEEEGDFAVEDDLLGRTWDAKILRVRSETLRRLDDGRVILCVDFKGEDAKDSQPLDIDFTLSREGMDMTVEELVIHKVAGKARFAYDAKNKRVPVKAGKAGEKKAE